MNLLLIKKVCWQKLVVILFRKYYSQQYICNCIFRIISQVIQLLFTEFDNLNTILANLEKCVDQLDKKASNLTEKIKEFLEENQIDLEPEDPLIDQQKSGN